MTVSLTWASSQYSKVYLWINTLHYNISLKMFLSMFASNYFNG